MGQDLTRLAVRAFQLVHSGFLAPVLERAIDAALVQAQWRTAGVREPLFKASRADPDFEYALVDATICKAHADASGTKGAAAHAIGRLKGGLTTKVHTAVDALALPVRTAITPGQWGDAPQARGLIEGLQSATDVHVIVR